MQDYFSKNPVNDAIIAYKVILNTIYNTFTKPHLFNIFKDDYTVGDRQVTRFEIYRQRTITLFFAK